MTDSEPIDTPVAVVEASETTHSQKESFKPESKTESRLKGWTEKGREWLTKLRKKPPKEALKDITEAPEHEGELVEEVNHQAVDTRIEIQDNRGGSVSVDKIDQSSGEQQKDKADQSQIIKQQEEEGEDAMGSGESKTNFELNKTESLREVWSLFSEEEVRFDPMMESEKQIEGRVTLLTHGQTMKHLRGGEETKGLLEQVSESGLDKLRLRSKAENDYKGVNVEAESMFGQASPGEGGEADISFFANGIASYGEVNWVVPAFLMAEEGGMVEYRIGDRDSLKVNSNEINGLSGRAGEVGYYSPLGMTLEASKRLENTNSFGEETELKRNEIKGLTEKNIERDGVSLTNPFVVCYVPEGEVGSIHSDIDKSEVLNDEEKKYLKRKFIPHVTERGDGNAELDVKVKELSSNPEAYASLVLDNCRMFYNNPDMQVQDVVQIISRNEWDISSYNFDKLKGQSELYALKPNDKNE